MSDPCPWVPLGPSVVNGMFDPGNPARAPVSGRVTALAMTAERHLLVGTAGGGVWRTKDEGVTWEPLTDQALSLSIGALAVASDGTIYIGTGEFNSGGVSSQLGAGILVTKSDLSQWSLFPPPSVDALLLGQKIGRIVVDPADSRHLFVATSLGVAEMIFSTDAGVRKWTLSIPSTVSDGSCNDLAVDFQTDPTKPRIYAAFAELGLFTKDGDDPLQLIALASFPGLKQPFERVGVALSSTDPKTLYASFSATDGKSIQIFQSRDRGLTWKDFTVPGTPVQTNYNLVLVVDPDDPGALFLGEKSLWHSDGTTWKVLSEPHGDYQGIHDDQHALLIAPADAAHPRVFWAGNDGGVWRSDDGARFFPRNRDLGTFQIYSVSQHPTVDNILFMGTQDNGANRYFGHPLWQQVDQGDRLFTGIDPKDPTHWYDNFFDITGFERSDSAGAPGSFNDASDGIDPTDVDAKGRPRFAPFVIAPSLEGRLYLGTDKLYWSHDAHSRGRLWEVIPPTKDDSTKKNYITAIGVVPNDPDVVYFARRDPRKCYRVMRATDGTWKMDEIGELPGVCNSIAVRDIFTAYWAIGYDYAGEELRITAKWRGADLKQPTQSDPVLRTRRVWKSQPGPIDLQLNSLGGLPDLSFLNGRSRSSTDALPPDFSFPGEINQANAIVLDPSNPSVIFVGCDIGVFKSTDDGATWVSWSDGLPNALISDLQLHPSRLLRVATLGRGVWERAVDDPPSPCASTVLLHVRDSLLDNARDVTADSEKDNPLGGAKLNWNDGADIKIDTEVLGSFQSPSSTLSYLPGGPIDYLGFEDDALKSKHVRAGATSRVFVQVHNRGSQTCTSVDVRLFFAKKSDVGFPYPALPDDFGSKFPADASDITQWIPFGAAQQLTNLTPASPQVAAFDFAFPSDLKGTIGILAVVSSAQDPLPATLPSFTDVTQEFREERRMALREVPVDPSLSGLALDMLKALGLLRASP